MHVLVGPFGGRTRSCSMEERVGEMVAVHRRVWHGAAFWSQPSQLDRAGGKYQHPQSLQYTYSVLCMCTNTGHHVRLHFLVNIIIFSPRTTFTSIPNLPHSPLPQCKRVHTDGVSATFLLTILILYYVLLTATCFVLLGCHFCSRSREARRSERGHSY